MTRADRDTIESIAQLGEPGARSSEAELDRQDVMRALGVGRRTLRQMMKKGRIIAHRWERGQPIFGAEQVGYLRKEMARERRVEVEGELRDFRMFVDFLGDLTEYRPRDKIPYTARDAALLLGVTQARIYQLLGEGKLTRSEVEVGPEEGQVRRGGWGMRVTAESLESYVMEREAGERREK